MPWIFIYPGTIISYAHLLEKNVSHTFKSGPEIALEIFEARSCSNMEYIKTVLF